MISSPQERLGSRLPFFRELDSTDPDAWVQRKGNTLEAFVDRGGPVKLAFFGGLDTLGRIEDPRRAAGSRVQVASLIDLAGMKMRVIQVRGNWKDYVDLHTLAAHGVDVATGLAAAKAIDRNCDPGISIRALQFYGDGTLGRVPAGMQRDLTRWAQAVDLGKLPVLHAKRGLNPEGLENAPAGVFTQEAWRRWHERFGMPAPPLPRRRFPDGLLGPETGEFFGR